MLEPSDGSRVMVTIASIDLSRMVPDGAVVRPSDDDCSEQQSEAIVDVGWTPAAAARLR